jgi:hypothetical protein
MWGRFETGSITIFIRNIRDTPMRAPSHQELEEHLSACNDFMVSVHAYSNR